MDADVDAENLTLRLSHDEALRLGIALRAGCETVSRAEYYIRTGLSEPEVESLAAFLIHVAESADKSTAIPLEAGVEAIENPRRPRPGRD